MLRHHRSNELILLAKKPNYSYRMATESHLGSISKKHSEGIATLTEVRELTQMSKCWTPKNNLFSTSWGTDSSETDRNTRKRKHQPLTSEDTWSPRPPCYKTCGRVWQHRSRGSDPGASWAISLTDSLKKWNKIPSLELLKSTLGQSQVFSGGLSTVIFYYNY